MPADREKIECQRGSLSCLCNSTGRRVPACWVARNLRVVLLRAHQLFSKGCPHHSFGGCSFYRCFLSPLRFHCCVLVFPICNLARAGEEMTRQGVERDARRKKFQRWVKVPGSDSSCEKASAVVPVEADREISRGWGFFERG